MYGDEKPSNSSFNLKAEPTFVVNPNYEDEGTADEQDCDFDDDAEDVMYTSNRCKKSNSKCGNYSQANSQPRRQEDSKFPLQATGEDLTIKMLGQSVGTPCLKMGYQQDAESANP